MNKVNISEIDFNDDYSYTRGGAPFTGLACEYDGQGNLVAEMAFENGMQEGISKQYFLSGQVWFEKSYHNSSMHGESREWFENGKLKRRTLHEFGFLLESDDWDDRGQSLASFRLEETDPQHKLLVLSRLRKR